MGTIHSQLMAFGATKPGLISISSSKRTADLQRIFTRALILKAEMRACGEDYNVAWTTSGLAVDRSMFEELHADDRPQRVVCAVSPLVWKKNTGGDEWSIVCRGKMLSQAMPNSEPSTG